MLLSLLRTALISDPLIVLSTSVMGTLSTLAALFDGTGRAPHNIARAWARTLLAVSGIQLRVEGLDCIDSQASYVFASNHLSLIDTPVVLAAIPAEFRFLAKLSLRKVPFIGWHLNRAGHIFVPLGDTRASAKVMRLAAGVIRRQGISIHVFPEGGRSHGELQEFKEGAAYLAIKAGVPLVPLAITGTLGILPTGSINVKAGQVLLRIGDPIPTTGLKRRDRTELTARLREEISRLLAETRDSTLNSRFPRGQAVSQRPVQPAENGN